MTKKKQPDFQPNKLKPGRKLPSGTNVTKVSYKSKKIIMPRQAHKEKANLTIQDCIKNALSSTKQLSSKEIALNQLNNLILDQRDTFSVHLSVIFDEVANLILHENEELRNAAVKVLTTVLEHSDDKKIGTFFTRISYILSCGMTNPDLKIKGTALQLLNVLLSSHPNLTCCSMTLLQNLLSLLTGQSYNTKSRKAVNKSNVSINYGDGVMSPDWRFHVLANMSMFLKTMLENFKTSVEVDEEENTVYWDCNSTLYLEIFAGGGLKPVDIEKFTSCLAEKNELCDPVKIEEFLTDFIEVLSRMFIEEFTGSSKGDDDLILRETIANLNVLFQVLCYLGDWVTIFSDSNHPELEEFFVKSLTEKFFKLIEKFPFNPRGPIFAVRPKNMFLPCVQLNLSVCYLYSAFILKPDSSNDSFLSYPSHVLNELPFEARYDSIPVLLKIVRLYVSRMKTSQPNVVPVDYLKKLLFQLSKMLKIEDHGSNMRMLFSFFIEMSLEIDYKFNSEYLKVWYSHLLGSLKKLKDSNKTNRKILKDVTKIAIRKNFYFLDALEKLEVDDFIEMLEHENDDLKVTTIYLIYNMKNFPKELFPRISEVLLTNSAFPHRATLLLIRLLTDRFSQPGVSAEDRVNCISFLINTAIDAVNLDDEMWLNYDLPAFKAAWEPCKSSCAYKVIPSLHWEQHSKLFELCQQSLNRFPTSTVNYLKMEIINQVSNYTADLPIHSLIAILRLHDPGMESRRHKCVMMDLTFASLFFLSIFSTLELPDEWCQCNSVPLMNSLSLNRMKALGTMQIFRYDKEGTIPGIVAHHYLRICKYFVKCNFFLPQDRDPILAILENVKDRCEDETLCQQTLYVNLINFFSYYIE